MKINAERALELRRERSWSQEELAIASGLNLRTIQRIENQGTASLQSKKALASTFEIDVADLDYQEEIMKYEYKVLHFDVSWKRGKLVKDTGHIESTLNELGADGWELKGIEPIAYDMGTVKGMTATLVRPRRD